MAKSKHPKYYSRKFINKGKGTAFIENSFSVSSYSIDGGIKLSDCNRNIDLDFHMWDKKSIKEKIDKLDILINEFTAAKSFIIEHTEYFMELKASDGKGKKSLLQMLNEEDDD